MPFGWRALDPEGIGEEIHFRRRVACFTNRPSNLWVMCAETLSHCGEKEACVLDGRRLTYIELDMRAGRIAAALARRGVRAGDRVALFAGNLLEVAEAIWALLRLGAVAVPLGYRLGRRELKHMLNDSGAKVAIAEARLVEKLPERRSTPALEFVFSVGGETSGCDTYQVLIDHTVTIPAPAAVDEESLAFLLYTSGTTGLPKGAMLTHLNVIHSVIHYRRAMDLTADDRTLLAVPVTHVTGLVAQLITMFGVGGCVVLIGEFRAEAAIRLLAEEHITHSLMVPAMYHLISRSTALEEPDLSSFRIGGFGGAPMPEATIVALSERFPQLRLMNVYGATETTSPATILPPDRIADRRVSVGIPMHCAEIIIADETGRALPLGQSGEILIRGPMVIPGYWNSEEATEKPFMGGFWRSGDIGRMDEEGFLFVLDRVKDLINRGGYKVFSAEVENVLILHPKVSEAAVVPRQCPVLGERVHAFVTPVPGAELTADQIIRYCRDEIADYKAPEYVTFLPDGLPRNANGKVQKMMLREMAQTVADETA